MTEGLDIRIGANVAQAVNGIKQVNNSLSQLQVQQKRAQGVQSFAQSLRELPAFAFSAQTGILALSNNIPILIDNFKSARASGLTFGQTLAQVGKSLFSFGGIATIAITALTIFGDKIFGAAQKTEDAGEKIRSFGEIVGESTAGVQGDIARVEALAKAASNSANSFSVQKNAIAQLKDISKSYFGELEAGKSTYEQITTAVNNYSEALVANAILQGFTEEIKKVSLELDKQKEILKPLAIARGELIKKAKAFRDEEAKNKAISLGTLEYQKQLEVIVGLQEKFDGLKEKIGEAAVEASKFKPLTGGDKDLKDETDKIIARARAFVKQFGDVFQTPDLEESFTNTKDIIKKAAIKLFDDLANGNLKIKIPVQVITEADFLQTETSIDQSELDDLRKNYLEELRKEFQEPFVFDPSIQIAVDAEKAKAETLKKAQELAATMKDIMANAFASLGEDIGNAVSGGGNLFATLFEIIGSGVAALGKQIIALGVAALAVKKSLASLLANPGLAIAAGVALTAVGTAMKNIAGKGIRGFAEGGVVASPTLAMIGEGAGTRNSNPEIVAPLNKLKDMIGSSGGVQVEGEFRLQGQDLVASIARTTRRQGQAF